MMGIRREVALRVALVLLVLGAACRGPADGASVPRAADATGSPAPEPLRLVMSYSNLSTDQWPAWIAQDMGLFARHGLDVDLRLIESTTGVAALISGETQAAVIGGSEVLNAAVEGADLRIIGSLSRTFSFRFMAPTSVQTPDDLRGKRVGVSRIGSSSDVASRLALQRLGLVPNQDVEIVQLGSLTARLQALEAGAIQGAVAQPPETARLAQSGYHVVFDVGDLGLPASTAIVAARRGDLTERRAALQGVIDGLTDAMATLRSDPAGTQAVLGRWLKQDDAELLTEAWSFYVDKITPRNPRIEPEQLESARGVLQATNPRVAGYDFASLIDNSLVDAAVARGLGAP